MEAYIQSIVGVAGLAIGITYVAGGMIVSLHLSRYGVTDYQIVRVKYLVVGLTYLITAISILVLSGIPAFFLAASSQWIHQSLFILSLLVSLGLLWLWSRPVGRVIPWSWRLWVAAGALATIFPVVVIIRQTLGAQTDFYSVVLIVEAVVAGVLAFIGQVYYYARYLYADPGSWLGSTDPIGSGVPVNVQLAGEEKDIELLDHMGASTARPGLTEKVLLLDETDTHYIIGVARDKGIRAVKVTKDIVKAILYLG